MERAQLDLCIVAGRRPVLLAETLESFSEHVFTNFYFANVLVNIDPIFGDEGDEENCVELLQRYFPQITFLRPERASFAAAVKRLWSSTKSDFVFHLEDDWTTLRAIGTEALTPFENSKVAQVSFHHADQNWDISKKGNLHRRNEYGRVFGLKIPLFRTFPKFTTSPSILRGDFARKAASLMSDAKDPEKQFYSGVNPQLEQLAAPVCNYIFSPEKAPVIRDIGRSWREARQIEKVIKDATSFWSTHDQGG
jgi:hypothetical protein